MSLGRLTKISTRKSLHHQTQGSISSTPEPTIYSLLIKKSYLSLHFLSECLTKPLLNFSAPVWAKSSSTPDLPAWSNSASCNSCHSCGTSKWARNSALARITRPLLNCLEALIWAKDDPLAWERRKCLFSHGFRNLLLGLYEIRWR